MIPVTAAHLPATRRLLESHPELAMFPLDNLTRYGLGDTHSRSMRFWVDDLAQPSWALGLSREGGVMPIAPNGLNASGCADLLRGRPILGFSGAASAVRAILDATGLTGHAKRLDADEPQFRLDLRSLAVPEGPGQLVPVSEAKATAVAWRHAYTTELHLVADPEDGERDVDRWIATDSHRLLVVDGKPIAMTGFNARLPGIVQVGGVYTPPALRGRGYARRALALHLAQARAEGVTKATLFAASDAAVACYEPLGFERIGAFALVLFGEEVVP